MSEPTPREARALEELYQLAEKFCAQELTAEEAARLSELLRENPDQLGRFLEHSSVHAGLWLEYGRAAPKAQLAERANAAPKNDPLRILTRWRFFCLAGLGVGICILLGWQLWLRSRPGDAPVVAVLKNAAQARWGSGTAPGPGDALNQGSTLHLAEGVAAIEFQCGALAMLEGPAEIELVGSAEAYLHSGRIVINVSDKCNFFRLETPTARLLDLGTEFGVSVGNSGDTIVQVYQGVVLAKMKQSNTARDQRIEGGQAQQIDGKESRETVFDPDGFIRYLPGADDPRGRGTRPYNKSRYDAVHVVPAPRKVVIDGDLSDWDLSGRFVSACDPPYDKNYYVEGSMMFDDKFLYLGAHVGDPFPMRSTISPHIKRDTYGYGGCVAFRLSADRKLGWPIKGENIKVRHGRPANSADLNQKLAILALWFYRPEEKACLHIRYGMDLQGVRINPEGYQGAYRMDGDGKGYTMEYAIPWSLLHAADEPPRGGDTLGATWLVHWSESKGRDWMGQLIECTNLKENGLSFQRAATWGKAIYHSTGNLPPGTVALRSE